MCYGAGLEPLGCIVNKPAHFTIDARRAGRGPLKLYAQVSLKERWGSCGHTLQGTGSNVSPPFSFPPPSPSLLTHHCIFFFSSSSHSFSPPNAPTTLHHPPPPLPSCNPPSSSLFSSLLVTFLLPLLPCSYPYFLSNLSSSNLSSFFSLPSSPSYSPPFSSCLLLPLLPSYFSLFFSSPLLVPFSLFPNHPPLLPPPILPYVLPGCRGFPHRRPGVRQRRRNLLLRLCPNQTHQAHHPGHLGPG